MTDRSFEVAAAKNYTRVAPTPESLPERVERLADGVFVFHNVSAVSQNTLAVELKDYIAAVEAPADRLAAQPRSPKFLLLEKGRRVLTGRTARVPSARSSRQRQSPLFSALSPR